MKADDTLTLFPSADAETSEPTLGLERYFWARGLLAVAGVDEAGRGCLAGPVVAAAVVLPVESDLHELRDSKRLSAARRSELAELIRASAVAVAVGSCEPEEIDRMNILQASLEAMRRAVDLLDIGPDVVLVDGNVAPPVGSVPVRTVVKGDARCRSIAAASIIAKTVRDALMLELHERHPGYGWRENKGYPTPAHYEALSKLGPSPVHRKTFRLRR